MEQFFTRLFLLAAVLSSVLKIQAQNIEDIDIPYTKYILSNGLTLIVHEDHKAPIVAVNIWYHVGSKNEKQGKTGFAHLFEHLMFNGSENYNDDYFQVLERAGATDLNGTTNEDRTNYFQNVPTSAVDLALWMESDRMGHLLGAVTQAKLDEQRGVVQNEKRQWDNEPYSVAYNLIAENTYPKGHPYSWQVIGSMEDLNAASLDDVHEWFKKYYGPSNAVLVIAGDITKEEAKAKVEKYFGDIPAGPPIAKYDVWVSKMTGSKRQIAQDRIPQSKIYKTWNVPELGNAELTYLDLVSDVLAAGKISRLFKRLVYEDQIATDVSAYYDGGEIGSRFRIEASAKEGVDLSIVEKALNEELQRFIKEGPTSEELERVKTNYIANFIRGIERIGGFGGKSDILALNEIYNGSPDYYKKILAIVKNASADDLRAASWKWLSDGEYILELHPFPQYSTAASSVDRKKLPETGVPPVIKFPVYQTDSLTNGLKIVISSRPSIPIVKFDLVVDGGYAADQYGSPGTGSLMMDMMDEGTTNRDALTISEELSQLGSRINTGSSLDVYNVYFSTLKSNLDKSLEIYADVVLNPSFPASELERLKQQRIAQIKNEKASPGGMAYRVFPVLLYGKSHAYGTPLTGSGYEEDVEKLTRDKLADFYRIWFKPNSSTLIITGDISLQEIKPKLEKVFGSWKAGEIPKKNITDVAPKDKQVIYLMDKPQAEQSIILTGNVTTPRSDPDYIAEQSMNTILGGSFTSRINMNLREDKHWSYGSGSFIIDAKGQRPFIVYGLVQTDKTKESIQEIVKELKGITSNKPATQEELDKIKLNLVLSLPGTWETNDAVTGSLSDIVIYNLPADYYDLYPGKIKSLSLNDINAAAKKAIQPDNITWAIIGDKAKIYDDIKKLGYEIKLIDSNGNILDETQNSVELKKE